jgi:hypothetical protein
MPEDPYPLDWIYEIPAGEYCTAHGIDEDETANHDNHDDHDYDNFENLENSGNHEDSENREER